MFSKGRRRRTSRSRAAYEGKVLYEFESLPIANSPPARAQTWVHAAFWSLLSVAVRRRFGASPLHQS
jgi:hypothetical protein